MGVTFMSRSLMLSPTSTHKLRKSFDKWALKTTLANLVNICHFHNKTVELIKPTLGLIYGFYFGKILIYCPHTHYLKCIDAVQCLSSAVFLSYICISK